MATAVADRSSNKNEQIVHAAEVIGRSEHRRVVFKAIYTGKAAIKSVITLMKATGLVRNRVLDAGKALADNDLVVQTRDGSVTAYEKIDFMQRYRDRILAAATNRAKREAIPTKRNSHGGKSVTVTVKIPQNKNRAQHVTVDEIESFDEVRRVPNGLSFVKMPEKAFKDGVAAILGERGSFQDWGGELRDLSSTRVRIGGKRRAAAFAFKGPGKTGRLTPAKMGKHGDQIQRLAKCPAEVFIVQYWAEVDDSVLAQLEQLVQLKSFLESRKLWYGIIDGQDSARLIQAYPKKFAKKQSSDGRRKQ
jgi:hypothetical protein